MLEVILVSHLNMAACVCLLICSIRFSVCIKNEKETQKTKREKNKGCFMLAFTFLIVVNIQQPYFICQT